MEAGPCLPLEVAELIIDDLAEEDDSTFSSLKQLSLACQHFLPLARKHIFGTIILGKRDDSYELISPTVYMLHKLLLQNPVLSGYIHTLVCYDLEHACSKPLISSLFNQVTNLRSLTIDGRVQGPIGRIIDWSSPDRRSGILTSLPQLPNLSHLRLQCVRALLTSDLMPFVGLKTLELADCTYDEGFSSRLSTQSRSIQLRHFSLGVYHRAGGSEVLWTPGCADGRPLLDLSTLQSVNLEFSVLPNNGLDDTRLLGLFSSQQLIQVRLRFIRVRYFKGISRLLRGSQESLKKIGLETVISVGLDNPRNRQDIFREICHELEEISQWSIVEETSFRVVVYSEHQASMEGGWGSLDRALTSLEWRRLKRVTVVVVVEELDSEDQIGGPQAEFRALPARELRGLSASPTVEFKFIITDQ